MEGTGYIRTETHECTRKEGELDVVEFVDVDIVAPRFVFEQFHEPAEAAFNPRRRIRMARLLHAPVHGRLSR